MIAKYFVALKFKQSLLDLTKEILSMILSINCEKILMFKL